MDVTALPVYALARIFNHLYCDAMKYRFLQALGQQLALQLLDYMGQEPYVLVFHMKPTDVHAITRFKLPFNRLRLCVAPLTADCEMDLVFPTDAVEYTARTIDVLIVSNNHFETFAQRFLTVSKHTIIGVVLEPYAALHCTEGTLLCMQHVRFISMRRHGMVHGNVFRHAPGLEHLFFNRFNHAFVYGIHCGKPQHWIRETYNIGPWSSLAKHVHATETWTESNIADHCRRVLAKIQ